MPSTVHSVSQIYVSSHAQNEMMQGVLRANHASLIKCEACGVWKMHNWANQLCPPCTYIHVYVFPTKILTTNDIILNMNDITKREYTEKGSILFTHAIYRHRYIHPYVKHMYGYHVTNESNRNYAILYYMPHLWLCY